MEAYIRHQLQIASLLESYLSHQETDSECMSVGKGPVYGLSYSVGNLTNNILKQVKQIREFHWGRR